MEIVTCKQWYDTVRWREWMVDGMKMDLNWVGGKGQIWALAIVNDKNRRCRLEKLTLKPDTPEIWAEKPVKTESSAKGLDLLHYQLTEGQRWRLGREHDLWLGFTPDRVRTNTSYKRAMA